MPKHWAGGNVNKLLSIVATKLAFIELREQEMRADKTDVARSITTYLMSCQDNSSTYLKEEVRRIAQAWVESRKIHKDIDSSQFHTVWNQIKASGFQHAIDSCTEMATEASAHGFTQDATKIGHIMAKFLEVRDNGTEQLQSY